MGLPLCTWCGQPYNQLSPSTDYDRVCSERCRQAKDNNRSNQFHKSTGGLFNGNFVSRLQDQLQFVQLQQQSELAAQQNALIAEQNRMLATEEAQRRQLQAIAERQACWKQFLFEVNQVLDAITETGDEVSLLGHCVWFILLSQQHDFTASDFSEINDKQYFANSRRRIDAIRSQVSENAKNSFKNFQNTLSEYNDHYLGRSTFPEAKSTEFTKKPLVTTFGKPKPKLKKMSEKEVGKLLSPPKELADLRKKDVPYICAIVAAMACNLLLPCVAIIPAVLIYYFGLKPLQAARQPLEDKFKQQLEEAKQVRNEVLEAKHQRAVDQWEREFSKFKASLPELNREIEEYNAQVQLRFDTAQANWLAHKRKLVNEFNDFLDEHPTLNAWYQKLEPVNADS